VQYGRLGYWIFDTAQNTPLKFRMVDESPAQRCIVIGLGDRLARPAAPLLLDVVD
jgi:hypothetical protein